MVVLCLLRGVKPVARPPKRRRVDTMPPYSFFKPQGVPLRNLAEVQLTVEEVEALRLKDLEGLEQEACAERMGIARTTFQRILVGARRKVADALTNGKALRIAGGHYRLALRHLVCGDCGFEWDVPYGNGERARDMECTACGSPTVRRREQAHGRHGQRWGQND
jgi:predicted DNA-binding protein (UPF0251 family)